MNLAPAIVEVFPALLHGPFGVLAPNAAGSSKKEADRARTITFVSLFII
jgi:hypothetical protein